MKRIKWNALLLSMGVVTAAMLMLPQKAVGLDEKYLRNGECYMLIGEGGFKGIYRLNNPAAEQDSIDQLVIAGSRFQKKDTKGFTVDLDRNIYTFTEDVVTTGGEDGKGFTKKTGDIFRQVLDNSVSDDTSDYGSWSYYHYDARSRGRGTGIYRSNNTGNSTRYIRNSSSIQALGPGTPASKPTGYKLPEFEGRPNSESDLMTLSEYSGRSWYRIPNGAWFSSWHKNYNYPGYMVYSDLELTRPRKYDKLKWANSGSGNNVNFASPANNEGTVASSTDSYIAREYHCGCLDSCAADGGTGQTKQITKEIDIAMQPSFGGGSERVYALARDKDSPNYSLTLKQGTGDPSPYSAYLRGYPSNPDNEWIGISLKDASSDYVYVMGNSTMKAWLNSAGVSGIPSDAEFTAAAVSNRWDQKGGILYTYEKKNKMVYRLNLIDSGVYGLQNNPGIDTTTIGYIPVNDEISQVGGDNSCDVFDLKADGFGSLYLGVTFPTTNRSSFDPKQHLRPKDAIHMCVLASDPIAGYYKLNFIIPQEYSKAVFERKYNGGEFHKIGSKVFAREYYHTEVKVSQACYDDIRNYCSTWPNSTWIDIVKRYGEDDEQISINNVPVKNINFSDNTSPSRPSIFGGQGCTCSGFPTLNQSDPGECKLAVINVPTPDTVDHIGATNDSYLDICGPYDNFVMGSTTSTNQDQSLLDKGTSANPVSQKKLYFYMVENYPLAIAQDPNEVPDWDFDGRPGGFVSSLENSTPYSEDHNGKIWYEWKLWMVQSSFKDPATDQPYNTFELVDETASSTGSYFTYFYHPLGGKFILTCRVSYNWYDYDSIPFGQTKDYLPNVLRTKTFAWPSKHVGSYLTKESLKSLTKDQIKISPADRLTEIMNTPGFEFMQSTGIDYSQIYAGSNSDYWAMQPIICNTEVGTESTPLTDLALINRCDDVTNVGASQSDLNSYLRNDGNWSDLPSDGYFGLESGKSYYWRINLASQTNLFADISQINGRTKSDLRNYNYVADVILSKGVKNALNLDDEDGAITFENNVGDLKWQDDVVSVEASLKYIEPGTNAEKTLQIIADPNPASDGMLKYHVTNINTLAATNNTLAKIWNGHENEAIFASTTAILPPTDPKEAKLKITMKRWFRAKLLRTDPRYGFKIRIPNIPGYIEVSGEVKVRIMDTGVPQIVWNETSPNNLFGVTGKDFDNTLIGPSGESQQNINVTVGDNNPWEGITTETGISLEEFIKNYTYNYGYNAANNKFSSYPQLKVTFDNLNHAGAFAGYYTNGVIGEIKSKLLARQKSSHLNLKPMFSKYARDVRIVFETANRDEKGKALVYTGFATEPTDITTDPHHFYDDYSDYSAHERTEPNGYAHSPYISCVGSDYVYDVLGSSSAKVYYSMNTSNLEFTEGKKIPDGYANNTPGYRPYRFYINTMDSSGNSTGYKRLNVALHVKDDIAPIAYGALTEQKGNTSCRFPVYINEPNPASATSEPEYSKYIKGQNFMYDKNATNKGLDPKVLYNNNWKASGNFNYINYNFNDTPPTGCYNYQAGKNFNADGGIIAPCDDAEFISSLASYSQIYVEDNVPCTFQVFAADNCGYASGTLKVNYLEYNGTEESKWASYTCAQGSLVASDSVQDSGYSYQLSTNGVNTDITVIGSNTATVIFRGKDNQFPMAIPVEITATDNARNWDFYRPGSGHEGASGWIWDETQLVPGAPANNIRTFKTTVPVLGSKLNIRTIDKTIKNN